MPGKANGKIFRLSRTTEATKTMPHLQVEEDGRVVIGERPSFAEQRIDAEEQWRTTAETIDQLPENLKSTDPGTLAVARAQSDSIAFAFQKQLAAKVAAKQLDEASAGLLLKWGNVIEELDRRIGTTAAKRVMNEMVSQIPSGSLTEAQIDTFRRLVRTRTVEYLQTIRNGRQRMTALQDMLGFQPEPSSQGALFTEYRRGVLLATEDETSSAKLFGPREDTIMPFKLKGVTRTPDDAVTLETDIPGLEQGRYALEDKAGEHAFKMDQARDYAKGLAKGNSGYDGLIYVFSTRDEATNALKQLTKDPATEALLGAKRSGIHVSFFDARTGQWELLAL